ncbi:MAG TPA: response regulator [Saprospiraceae bacterium]|nr:response regulator [Saprospiraceae bacterium]HPI05310.1 response regulator [Saprospiraceae bacterium]
MIEATILIIDDEPPIRRLLDITLSAQHYRVMETGTARDGQIAAAMHPPDLILLDLGLPDEDGQALLLKLREWYSKPIIVLSARNMEEEIVQALDHGANDYLTKPFRTGELLARIRSALRVSRQEENNPVREFGNLRIDLVARQLRRNNELVHLTATEYALLLLLVQNEGRVLTHQFILREIWGAPYSTQSQYLRVYIGQLRKKIENNPNQPVHIITASGVGYRFSGSSL